MMIVVFRFPQTEIYDILPYYSLRVRKKTLAGSVLHRIFREIDFQFDLPIGTSCHQRAARPDSANSKQKQ